MSKIVRKTTVPAILAAVMAVLLCFTAACDNAPSGQQPSATHIEITGAKTVFAYGEDFSSGELSVSLVYDNGEKKILQSGEYTVTCADYDKTVAGDYTVTVAYKELSKTYTVTVKHSENVVSLRVDGGTREYQYGDEFSAEGFSYYITYEDGREQSADKGDVHIDSSAFNGGKEGSYDIIFAFGAITSTIKVKVGKMEKLNLLMIGNSFSEDTVRYTYEIAKAAGLKEINICNMYIGGCSLSQHWNNAAANAALYDFQTYSDGEWQHNAGKTMEYGIKYMRWDYISVQQASGSSGRSETYSDTDKLMNYIRNTSDNKNVKLLWNMTWAYQQNSSHADFKYYGNDQLTMYNDIINAVKTQILTRSFYRIIPAGTAVQNARTSFLGDNLTRDGYHLSYDIGRYIAGLTLIGEITGTDISAVNYAPYGIPVQIEKVCKESAANAVATPYEITNSVFDEKPEFITREELEERGLKKLDYMPAGCAYWQCMDTNNYNKMITDAKNSISFVATKRFTKEELPAGSVITVDLGWQYRPEAWKDDAPQSSRPDNVTSPVIEITEQWWEGFTSRAFNISRLGAPSLDGKQPEAVEAFRIYVPENTPEETVPSHYEDDKTLFSSNGLDIENFTQMKTLPVNGFYNSSIYADQRNEYSTPSLSPKFICFIPFTKETLPVGSVIVCDSGWQYRPDAWTGNVKNPSRPANVSKNFTVADEAWWGNYVIRGFNVSRTNSAAINQSPYSAAEHVRIYVPEK